MVQDILESTFSTILKWKSLDLRVTDAQPTLKQLNRSCTWIKFCTSLENLESWCGESFLLLLSCRKTEKKAVLFSAILRDLKVVLYTHSLHAMFYTCISDFNRIMKNRNKWWGRSKEKGYNHFNDFFFEQECPACLGFIDTIAMYLLKGWACLILATIVCWKHVPSQMGMLITSRKPAN